MIHCLATVLLDSGMRFIELAVIALAGAVFAARPAAADDVTAITTGGKGDLTMCRYMMGCNLYHHIALPPRIALGDRVSVVFGSNPKQYRFPVARIVRGESGCTLFSQTEKTEDVEKIEIASCGSPPAAK